MASLAPQARAVRIVRLAAEDDFDGWREAARALALVDAAPDEIAWAVERMPDLFAAPVPAPPAAPGAFAVPRPFVELAQSVVCHADPERFALLYAFLCRLRERPRAMEDGTDPLLRRLEVMAKAVRRDMHRMRASLRFEEVEDGAGARLVAWYEPEYHIVRANAGFFVRRFADRRWSILTPELSLHWDGEALSEGLGATKAEAPEGGHGKERPETALVPERIESAQPRETEMATMSKARLGDNAAKAWASVRDEAAHCTRCGLYKHATQTVFGEGPVDARILFVGEQPGDQEDLAGRPFVGPAGRLFDRALADAGIDRERIYVTNAVKHFKFERRGKRRIHEKPNAGEINACRWWLQQELALIRPPLIVALGATGARAVIGKVVTISALRGSGHRLPEGGEAWVTVHPSFLLRVRDDREAEYDRFVEELARIGKRAKALT